MENKKEVFILYEYNNFNNDYEYIKEYYNIKQLKEENKKQFNLKNNRSIYHYIKNNIEDNINLLNNKYLIIKEVLSYE